MNEKEAIFFSSEAEISGLHCVKSSVVITSEDMKSSMNMVSSSLYIVSTIFNNNLSITIQLYMNPAFLLF